MRVLVNQLHQHLEKKVTVEGWVHRIRSLKAVTFIILRDRSGLVQCVVEGQAESLGELTLESVVCIKGIVKPSKNKYQVVEILCDEVEILVGALSDLPIQINHETLELQMETQLNHRVLSLRHQHNQAIFRIQSLITKAFRGYLETQGFMEMFTPKIVKEGAEGGSEIFKLEYFGQTAYLAQSPQFYKQMMVASGFERVFEIGAVYRAEQHSTNRHLNEYVSMDFEMGFIEDEYELMTMEEGLLRHIMSVIETEGRNALEILQINCPKVPNEIPKYKMREAIEILKSEYGRTDLEGDLDPLAERQISEYVLNTQKSEFVFITHYPKHKRPMYTKAYDEVETRSFDLLFRGLEITTGGQRIHNYEELCQSIRDKGLNPKVYETYLETFKYGAPSHGGLAIGLERLTAQLIGLKNVRLASLFPRDQNRLLP